MTTFLRHNRIDLALHELRSGGSARALLLLHGLGERTPSTAPEWATAWPGAVFGLDFTGHGESSIPRGGGYSAEDLLADADQAVAALGDVTVVGRGLGAYVALMIAGARPGHVHGAVLCDGSGLMGGSARPTSAHVTPLAPSTSTPDAYALMELSQDLRPPDYAVSFVRLAVEGSSLEDPIAVCATVRPPWLEAVTTQIGVLQTTLADALQLYGS